MDGWLDVYLQVLPQKIEMDIQKQRDSPGSHRQAEGLLREGGGSHNLNQNRMRQRRKLPQKRKNAKVILKSHKCYKIKIKCMTLIVPSQILLQYFLLCSM